jgi:23S rRNA (guanosine2251-2'-O)-methyltransferase
MDNEKVNKQKVDNQKLLSSEDYIEGRNPCIEALKSGRTINKLLVAKGSKEGSINKIIRIAKDNGIVVQEVSREKLDNISESKSHQGVIALVAAKDYVEVDDILEYAASKNEHPFVVILDEIQDVHNFGSILRTADAVGVHGVIIPKRRSVSLNSSVAKTSAGAIEYVKVARVSNIAATIEGLKKSGLWIVGTEMSGEKTFYNADLKGPIALVIGSEGEGIGRLIKEKCDFLVSIPMKGEVASLNASVAAGIVMYEALKQRR